MKLPYKNLRPLLKIRGLNLSIRKISYLSEDYASAGIGTILEAGLLTVAGFHRASPSTSLDKRFYNLYRIQFFMIISSRPNCCQYKNIKYDLKL
jgi:hypothetical protein